MSGLTFIHKNSRALNNDVGEIHARRARFALATQVSYLEPHAIQTRTRSAYLRFKFHQSTRMQCPISLRDTHSLECPVRIKNSTNAIYELHALSRWFRVSTTDPLTRKRISWNQVVPAGRPAKKIRQLIRHEKMASDFTDPPAIDYNAANHAYATRFEQLFVVQSNGTLKCDADKREKVPAWFNNQRTFIHMLVGTEPPLLVLQDPQQGDIATTNRNKIEMINAYTHALIAYNKICDVLGRVKAPCYASKVQDCES